MGIADIAGALVGNLGGDKADELTRRFSAELAEKKRAAQDAAATVGAIPGAGTLWTFDGGKVQILTKGWLAIGAAGLGIWLLLGGR